MISRDYHDQTWDNVVVTEIVAEINPIAAAEPVVDLSRFSSFNRALRVMTLVIKFLRINANSFEALIIQDQQLHVNSM